MGVSPGVERTTMTRRRGDTGPGRALREDVEQEDNAPLDRPAYRVAWRRMASRLAAHEAVVDERSAQP